MNPGDERELDDWIERLAGRSAGSRSGAHDREPRLLRELISSRARDDERTQLGDLAGEAAESEAWHRLRSRLVQERMLGARAVAPRVWASLAAAAVLVLAVGIGVYLSSQPGEPDVQVVHDQPPRFRSLTAPTELVSADPLAAARRVSRVADRHGGRPIVYVYEQSATVDFQVSPAEVALVQRELAREIPEDVVHPGINRITFKSK